MAWIFCFEVIVMPEGIIRHMFPGGNTPVGFYSYYQYIIDRSTARRVFILKGGPGTGKSTLMLKVGLELAKQGLCIEFMHCSSDNNSLDGVVIPGLRIAIIDGTSPHVVDPIYPGAVDEIINLGQFWHVQEFIGSRDDIISINGRIKDLFASAYRYLNAAASLKEDTESIYEQSLDRGMEALFTHELIQKVLGNVIPSKTPGSQRCLFASAITPRGFSDYLDSICTGNRIIRLSAPAGNCTHRILETLKNAALLGGYNIETYFCPMSPKKIEHMVIPELSLSVITANEYHDISDINNAECSTFFINEFYKKDNLESYSKQLGFNRTYTEALLERAIENIAEAKSSHDELEKYYIKSMDFEGISRFRDKLLERILAYN